VVRLLPYLMPGYEVVLNIFVNEIVILDCHPAFTTIIILGGWAVKTAVANLVSAWVGGNAKAGETWLAYSIP
jgi:hypothetical protein